MNESGERGWRGECEELPERPTCAPPPGSLQAAAHKAAFDALATRAILRTKWGKGANPHSLKGVTFCEVRWRGLGRGSGRSRQEVDAREKSSPPAKSEITWRAPPGTPLPAPLRASRPGSCSLGLGRCPALPLDPTAAEFPRKRSLDQSTSVSLSLGPSLTVL